MNENNINKSKNKKLHYYVNNNYNLNENIDINYEQDINDPIYNTELFIGLKFDVNPKGNRRSLMEK